MLMCMESVYVVGGCKLLAKGCSCWLLFMVTKYPLFQPNAFIRKKLTFRLLLYMQSSSEQKDCCVCSGGDCRIAVETSTFF